MSLLTFTFHPFAFQNQITYLWDMEKFRKLTPNDLAFGIGRKATKEELEELFTRPLGKLVTGEEMLAELKERNTMVKGGNNA